MKWRLGIRKSAGNRIVAFNLVCGRMRLVVSASCRVTGVIRQQAVLFARRVVTQRRGLYHTPRRLWEKDINMPLFDTANKANGLIGKLVADLVLYLFSFVAESERANIKERQRQGIDAAMKRGVKFGRPKIGDAREIAECVARIKIWAQSIRNSEAYQQHLQRG